MTVTDGTITAAGWDESRHPRDQAGKFRRLEAIMADLAKAAEGANGHDFRSPSSRALGEARMAISNGDRGKASRALDQLAQTTPTNEVKSLVDEAKSHLQPLKISTGKPDNISGGTRHEVTHPDHGNIGHIARTQTTARGTDYEAIEPGGRLTGKHFRSRSQAAHHLAEQADHQHMVNSGQIRNHPIRDLTPIDGGPDAKPYGTPGSRWVAPTPGSRVRSSDGRTGTASGPIGGAGPHDTVPVAWDHPPAGGPASPNTAPDPTDPSRFGERQSGHDDRVGSGLAQRQAHEAGDHLAANGYTESKGGGGVRVLTSPDGNTQIRIQQTGTVDRLDKQGDGSFKPTKSYLAGTNYDSTGPQIANHLDPNVPATAPKPRSSRIQAMLDAAHTEKNGSPTGHQVHLQSIGKHPAKPVSEVKPGDHIVYNYGSASPVISNKDLGNGRHELTTQGEDGKHYSATRKGTTLVGWRPGDGSNIGAQRSESASGPVAPKDHPTLPSDVTPWPAANTEKGGAIPAKRADVNRLRADIGATLGSAPHTKEGESLPEGHGFTPGSPHQVLHSDHGPNIVESNLRQAERVAGNRNALLHDTANHLDRMASKPGVDEKSARRLREHAATARRLAGGREIPAEAAPAEGGPSPVHPGATPKRTADLKPGDRVESEYGKGTVTDHTDRSISYKLDPEHGGDLLNVQRGTPGYNRIKPSDSPAPAAPNADPRITNVPSDPSKQGIRAEALQPGDRIVHPRTGQPVTVTQAQTKGSGRINSNTAISYETPSGSRGMMDSPPNHVHPLADPISRLSATQQQNKSDRAARIERINAQGPKPASDHPGEIDNLAADGTANAEDMGWHADTPQGESANAVYEAITNTQGTAQQKIDAGVAEARQLESDNPGGTEGSLAVLRSVMHADGQQAEDAIKGGAPSAPATVMNRPDRPVDVRAGMQQHDEATLHRMANDANLRPQDQQAAQDELSRRGSPLAAPAEPSGPQFDRATGAPANAEAHMLRARQAIQGASNQTRHIGQGPDANTPGPAVHLRQQRALEHLDKARAALDANNHTTAAHHMDEAAKEFGNAVGQDNQPISSKLVNARANMIHAMGSSKYPIITEPTAPDLGGDAVAEAERTGHIGNADPAALARNRTDGELKQIASSNPNTMEGRVAAQELTRRQVESNRAGTPGPLSGPDLGATPVSPSGRSAKMQRAFQAASEGDHAWLQAHGFDAAPGDRLDVSDSQNAITAHKPDGSRVHHAVNGNGQGRQVGYAHEPHDMRTVHDPAASTAGVPSDVGGAAEKQALRDRVTQANGGRSAKMERAFTAAKQGDHAWLASHGFSASPGQPIHINDQGNQIAIRQPDGSHAIHGVNGNGIASSTGNVPADDPLIRGMQQVHGGNAAGTPGGDNIANYGVGKQPNGKWGVLPVRHPEGNPFGPTTMDTKPVSEHATQREAVSRASDLSKRNEPALRERYRAARSRPTGETVTGNEANRVGGQSIPTDPSQVNWRHGTSEEEYAGHPSGETLHMYDANIGGYRVGIDEPHVGDGWRYNIETPDGRHLTADDNHPTVIGKGIYPSADVAKQAALDRLRKEAGAPKA